jgi:ABC-type nitrate/sulfonate/bicarbonate transport system ATPase subunit
VVGPVAAPVKIAARRITKWFESDQGRVEALDEVSVHAAPGEFVSIIGPSGSGKSTLFAILAGLERPTGGSVRVDGVDVTGRVDLTGYMPQKDLLLPWKTVLDNTVLGLFIMGVRKREARDRARALFPRFGLAGFEEYYPRALSGGMRQRAALLRTVLTQRDVLLLDEPFGALDALTRADMQTWLLDIWSSLSKTILFVTHDVDEAIYLSDRIYVLSARPGRVAAEFSVTIPRPRDYGSTVTSSPFIDIKRQVLGALERGRQ